MPLHSRQRNVHAGQRQPTIRESADGSVEGLTLRLEHCEGEAQSDVGFVVFELSAALRGDEQLAGLGWNGEHVGARHTRVGLTPGNGVALPRLEASVSGWRHVLVEVGDGDVNVRGRLGEEDEAAYSRGD